MKAIPVSLYETGTVVSAKPEWSGTSNRATPAPFVVTVATIEFSPVPVAFQTASEKTAPGGRPPML